MGSLFGGSKSKSENQAYGQIKDFATPLMGYADEGASGLSRLLGGDSSGFKRFADALGYDWEQNRGTDDILSQRAAVGGLDSGATLKGLANFQTGLNNSYSQNYMNNLLGLSNVGTNAAQILSGAGQKSTSSSSPGIMGALGGIASGIASGGIGSLAGGLAGSVAKTVNANPSIF